MYRTLQLFGLNCGPSNNGFHPVTLPFHASQLGSAVVILGLLVVSLAAGGAIGSSCGKSLSRALIIAMVGYGRIGRAIAHEYRITRGAWVVVADRDPG